MRKTLKERVWSRVKKGPGCWEWQGTLWHGYARMGIGGTANAHVHRLTYEWEYGPIPEGYTIDHRCENKACVKPSHLEAVTHKENQRRRHYRADPLTEQTTLWQEEHDKDQLTLWELL